MKKIITLISILFFPMVLFSQEGELDISFNGDGKFIYENKSNDEQIYGTALQPDGKILLVGPSTNSGWYKTFVMRLDIYGNPDPKFGNQGFVEMELGGNQSSGTAVAVQADEKILIAGTTEYDDARGFGVRRLLDDGNPDYSFGDSSKAFISLANFSHQTKFVGVQADGKIIAAGWAYTNMIKVVLARFMPDGSPDYSFGDSAIAVLNLPGSVTPEHFVMKPDGGMIAVGYTYVNSQSAFALVQVTSQGQLDANFGSNGLIIISFSDGASGEGVALQSDGKIVATGYAEVNGLTHFALIRLLSDGTLDQTFGVNGKVTHPIMNNDANGVAVAILGDGKIIVAGEAYGIWNRDFAVARFSSIGKIDKSFSFDGFTTKNMGPGNDYVHAAVLQPNGRLVVVGSCYNTYNSGSSSSSYDFAAARFLAGENTFGEFENDLSGISVYPNPASSVLNIEMEDRFENYDMELVDVTGKVYERMVITGSGTMDVSVLNSGVYILRVYRDGSPKGSMKVMVR